MIIDFHLLHLYLTRNRESLIDYVGKPLHTVSRLLSIALENSKLVITTKEKAFSHCRVHSSIMQYMSSYGKRTLISNLHLYFPIYETFLRAIFQSCDRMSVGMATDPGFKHRYIFIIRNQKIRKIHRIFPGM